MQHTCSTAVDEQHYKRLILERLEIYKEAKLLDINRLVLDKLPDVLDDKKKDNKVRNLLQAMKREGLIDLKGRIWRMSKR